MRISWNRFNCNTLHGYIKGYSVFRITLKPSERVELVSMLPGQRSCEYLDTEAAAKKRARMLYNQWQQSLGNLVPQLCDGKEKNVNSYRGL